MNPILVNLKKKLEVQASKEDLGLKDMLIGDEGLDILIEFLEKNKEYNLIDISGNNFSSKSFGRICKILKGNENLKTFISEWNNIGEKGGEGLEDLVDLLKANKTIKTVNLRNNKLGYESCRYLAEIIKHNKGLTHLDLKWNELGVAGARLLISAIDQNENIETLDLTCNKLNHQILFELENALKRKKGEPVQDREPVIAGEIDEQKIQENQINLEQLQQETIQKELNILIEREKNKRRGLQEGAERNFEQERRARLEIESKSTLLKESLLRKESNIANNEFKFNNLISERNALEAERKALHREISLLHENNSKSMRELDLKLASNQKDILRIEQRQDAELSRVLSDQSEHIREVENECLQRFSNLERRALQLRDIKDELEVKLNSICEENLRKRMDQEEQLRSIISGYLEEERSRNEHEMKNMESEIKTLEDTKEMLERKNQEIRKDLTKKTKSIYEDIMKLEKDIGILRMEMNQSHTKLCKYDVNLDKLKMGLLLKDNELIQMQEELRSSLRSHDRYTDINKEKLEQAKVEEAMEKRIWSESADHHHMKTMELEKLIRMREAENSHIKVEYEKLSNILQNNVSRVVVQTLHEFHNYLPSLVEEGFEEVPLIDELPIYN